MGNVLTLPSTSQNMPAPSAQPLPTVTISAPDSLQKPLPEIPISTTPEALPISAPAETAPTIEGVQLPSLDEMEAELNQSGLLLPELRVSGGILLQTNTTDGSPLAALQPGYKGPAPEFFTAPVIATVPHAQVPTSVGQNSTVNTNRTMVYATNEVQVGVPWRFPFEPLIALILGIQTVIGFSQVLYFAMYQYRPLEAQMIAGNVLATDLQNASLKAFGLVALGGTSILFAALVIIYRYDKRILTILLGCIVVIGANGVMQNLIAVPDLLSGNPATLFQAWTNTLR